MLRIGMILILLLGCKDRNATVEILHERKVHFQISYLFQVSNVKHLRVQALLPASIPGRQTILSMDYSLTPRVEVTESGDSLGHFRYYKPRDSVLLLIQGEAKLFLDTAIRAYPDSIRKKFLGIQQQVGEAFEYQLQLTDQNLDKALALGKGDCTEYAAYAARLCKQMGFESRELAGIHSRRGMDAFHSWTECRKDSLPWVVLDPTWADEKEDNLDSLERAGIQAIKNLEPTTWKLQLGKNPQLEYGFRLVSWRVDQGTVNFSPRAWLK